MFHTMQTENSRRQNRRDSLSKKSFLPAYAGFEITFLPRAKGDCVDLSEAKNSSIRASVYATLRLRNRARSADVPSESPRMWVFDGLRPLSGFFLVRKIFCATVAPLFRQIARTCDSALYHSSNILDVISLRKKIPPPKRGDIFYLFQS